MVQESSARHKGGASCNPRRGPISIAVGRAQQPGAKPTVLKMFCFRDSPATAPLGPAIRRLGNDQLAKGGLQGGEELQAKNN